VSFHRAALTLAAISGVIVVAAHATTRGPDARLLFTGDILLSRQVAVEMERTGASPWDSIAPFFAGADWVAGNLEGVIGSETQCLVPERELCFTDSDTTPRLLARAHFGAVSVENNHAGDIGTDGRARTRAALEAAGILALDFEHSPRFTRIGDVTLGLIGVNLVPAADGQVQSVPSVALAQKLRLARSLANVVIVSIHWGTELQPWVNASQHSAAEWLVEHGADVVVGHHPHVVQQPECVHGRPVFFSLGNHVFDQRFPATKEGLIADCRIHGGRLRCGGVRTRARRGSAVPVVVDQAGASELAACSVAVSPSLSVGGFVLRPVPWSAAASDSGLALEGWQDGALRWRTRRVQLVSLQAGLSTDADTRSFLALERHPSAMDHEVALRPHVYDVSAHGLIARWRGTALAWPLIDAVIDAHGRVCALHRGDSFIRLDPTDTTTRTMRYQWNGFGFSALPDSGECAKRL
jgi:poly-gamma-glutamate synthesis protein (capsule biosynthesis protein)